MAVPVEVRDDGGLGQQVGTFEQSRRLEPPSPRFQRTLRASHHDDVDEAVAIEVVEQERVNARVGVGAPGRAQREDPLEGGWAAANEHSRPRRIDPCGGEVTVLVLLRGPLDREVALDGDPPFARPFVRGAAITCRTMETRERAGASVCGGSKRAWCHSDWTSWYPSGRELANERRPLRRIEASARLGQREALDAVVQGFDGTGLPSVMRSRATLARTSAFAAGSPRRSAARRASHNATSDCSYCWASRSLAQTVSSSRERCACHSSSDAGRPVAFSAREPVRQARRCRSGRIRAQGTERESRCERSESS